MTREHVSRILELREMLLSFQTGFIFLYGLIFFHASLKEKGRKEDSIYAIQTSIQFV